MVENFGEIVLRLMPKGANLSALGKEARVGYDWLHSNVRGGKRASKSGLRPATGENILDSLERLGANVTPYDREAMMTACMDFSGVKRPYRVVSDNYISQDLAPEARRVAEAYNAAPKALKRAFESLAEAVPMLYDGNSQDIGDEREAQNGLTA